MSVPKYKRTIIGENDNSAFTNMNTFITLGDLNQNGRLDVIISGRDGNMIWLENPGNPITSWEQHMIDCIEKLECGGTTIDLTRNGYADIICGGDWRSDNVYWWENPGKENTPWRRHIITQTGFTQFHDEIIGDITNDGRISLLFNNQGNGSLNWVPLPKDPWKSPWNDIQCIAKDLKVNNQPEEGLAIADIDGDGKNEIIAGTHWFKYRGTGNEWECHKFAADYITTVIAVGDINNDGMIEIVLSEGDACIYGKTQGGKLAWFSPGKNIENLWEEHLIDQELRDPHTLQLGNICSNNQLDILVGEIGIADSYTQKPPRLMVYENNGKGNFSRHTIDAGTGTHHGRLVDLFGRGCLDIISRPLHGPEKWKIFAWVNESG